MAPIGGLEACPPGWLCRGLVLKSRRSRTLTGVFLGFLISAVALALLLRWSGWGPLWATLRQVDLRYLLAGALVFLASMLARARAWQLILKKEFGIWRVLAALNEGYLLNNILPWRMGELGRAILLGRRPGGSVMRVLSSILVERLYDVFLALSLLIALLPEAAGLPSALRSAAMVTLLLAGSATVIYVILRNPTWLRDLIGRLPGAGWEPRWRRLREGLTALSDRRLFLGSLLWLVVSWALAGLEYWLVLRSIIPGAQLRWAYFMLTVTLLGVAVPSSPGYLGVFEAAGVLALSVFAVPQAQALAATLLLHGMVYLASTTFGLIALSSEGATVTGLYAEIQSWLASPEGDQAV